MISFDKICSNLIPEGRYKAQITDVKFKVNALGESSKDMVVTLTIAEGAYAKKVIIDNIYEKAFSFKLKPFLLACKVDTSREFETADELYKFGLAAAKNKFVYVDLGTRTYNGKEYQEVKGYVPIEDSTTSSDDVLKAFGTQPVAKGEDLADMVEEVNSEPVKSETTDETFTSEEPNLDIDLDLKDEDLPF